MRLRILALAATALAVTATATGCGGSSTTPSQTAQPAGSSFGTRTGRFAGAELSPPRTAPPIALHDDSGRRVTLVAQRGRYALVTFLYVHCPDVCPLIAQNLNAALRRLGPARARVRVLAVSVDPKGDTPAAVRHYIHVRGLLPQFLYLIGSGPALERTWAAWHVAALRHGPDLVDHIAYTALVDPQGRERVLYDSRVTAHQVVHDLRALMSSHA